jgi:hypothetical protein
MQIIETIQDVKDHLKAKIDKIETNSKIKIIVDLYSNISYFKKCYQLRSNIVKNGKGNLVTDFHINSFRWRNHFSELFDIHGLNYVKQTYIHTAEQLVPNPSASEDEMVTEKIKRHKSPGADQIPTNFIIAGNTKIV